MINIVAFTIAAVLWLAIWAIGAKAVDSALLPLTLLVTAVAIYTYIPLLKKTIHGDDA